MINKYWTVGLLCLLFSFNTSAQGDVKKGKLKAMACAGCHGPTGNSFVPNFPSLAGQPAGYVTKQIQDFKSSDRFNAMMSKIALNISKYDAEHLGAFYESQIKIPAIKNIAHIKTDTEKSALLNLGQKLYNNGNKKTGQAACFTCHGKNGDAMTDLNVPVLANQQPQYLISTMKDFKDRSRANDNERVMRRIVDTMSDKEIEAVAYYSSYLVSTLKDSE